MKKNFNYDLKFLGAMILICIAANVAMRKKSLDGFVDFNMMFESMKNASEKQSLHAIKVIGNKVDGKNSDLVNWASWDPYSRNTHEVESAGSYGQYTNNEKKWN